MYDFGTVKTSWVKGEVPTPADLNRIEENIGAANLHNWTQRLYLLLVPPSVPQALALGLSMYGDYSIYHTTRTGRILVHCAMSFYNNGASLNTAYGTVDIGGVNPGGATEMASTEVMGNSAGTLFFSYIRTGLAVGGVIHVRAGARRGAGSNVDLTHVVLSAVDI